MSVKVNNKLTKQNSIILKLIPYIYCFFIFSFMGWILETVYCYCILSEFIKRGFLNSPICPIYGSGALILTIYLDNCKKKTGYLKLFLMFTIIFSFFEYIVGFTLDALFAARWWDYSNSKYNLNGRITWFNSLAWGVITILFARFLYPLIQKFKTFIESKLSKQIQISIGAILILGIIIDLVFSCIKYLN